MENKNYNLQIDATQAHVLIKALDLFSRIKCGQIKEIGHVLRWAICAGERDKVSPENMEIADQLLDKVAMLYFPELPLPGASYGIREAPGEDEKLAYDIQQVIRHRIAWDNAKPGETMPGGVWGYEPSRTAQHPLPKIEEAKK
jgi:hypothetical protein